MSSSRRHRASVPWTSLGSSRGTVPSTFVRGSRTSRRSAERNTSGPRRITSAPPETSLLRSSAGISRSAKGSRLTQLERRFHPNPLKGVGIPAPFFKSLIIFFSARCPLRVKREVRSKACAAPATVGESKKATTPLGFRPGKAAFCKGNPYNLRARRPAWQKVVNLRCAEGAARR